MERSARASPHPEPRAPQLRDLSHSHVRRVSGVRSVSESRQAYGGRANFLSRGHSRWCRVRRVGRTLLLGAPESSHPPRLQQALQISWICDRGAKERGNPSSDAECINQQLIADNNFKKRARLTRGSVSLFGNSRARAPSRLISLLQLVLQAGGHTGENRGVDCGIRSEHDDLYSVATL